MLIAMGSVSSAALAKDACSPEMYKRADASLRNSANDWDSLEKHRKTFAACDDGALAEGYSDAVVNLLARRWDRFGALVALARSNPDLHRWTIGHIDASALTEDLKAVARNAARCAAKGNTKELCREIEKAAVDALSD